ncbi:TonB family protein [Collimonas pratensis]|uniref:energy transducer TonB n=1 Tax=Collimonas pratensis TaxID=279113 RepID=UPI00143D461F|nr:TonB family protein [Collimonas pratensis]NKI72287.1 TonB family protein [Collimonas pratensis]
MSITTLSHPNDVFLTSLHAERPWWHKPGALTSFGLHAVAIAAIWGLSHRVLPPATPERVIELVLSPKQLTPPEPPPLKIEPQKPQPKISSARPLPTPTPAPRSKPVAAGQAEIATPPAVPITPASAEPVKAAAPEAPPAPPKLRVISNDGIPSDYVNQVYSRISRHTSYPRAAKMRKEEGRVAYKLTLSPQGELLKYEIQTSGSEALDEAAIDAIKGAAPFPKLPELGGSSYLLAGAIVFKVN